jgi:hypothetical protein
MTMTEYDKVAPLCMPFVQLLFFDEAIFAEVCLSYLITMQNISNWT